MRIVLAVFFVCFRLIVFSQPEFFVEKATFKFPKTERGQFLEHNFQLTNTGNAPLILTSYNVQCPCTKVILPSRPIAPGETIPLKVTFDSNGKYGFQDRIIEVYANTKKGKHKLRIKVNVVEPK